jgi:predicted nucleic acid-binding protein
VTGVLGILMRAKKDRNISALKPQVDALRAKARFFIAPSLEARILAEVGE